MKKFTILLFTLITFISFTACKNPPIFATIEQEIKLKTFSVHGSILGFAEIDSKIYVANPSAVFTKSKTSTGTWSTLGSIDGHVCTLAKSGKVLFASVRKGGVYYYDTAGTKTWTFVSGSGDITEIYGDDAVVGYAYDSKSEKYKFYKLDKSGTNTITIGGNALTSDDRLKGATGIFFTTANKLYSLAVAVATEKKSISSIKSVCKGPGSSALILSGSTVYQYDGANLTSKSFDKSGSNAIFYFEGRKTILISCNSGYTELKFDSVSPADITKSSQKNPGNSGSTTPSSSYEQYDATLGSLTFNPIFAVGTNSDYAVYAGISAHPLRKNTGLWAYYSSSEEWNRE